MRCTDISNSEKAQVWQDYRQGHPSRVPVLLVTNPRVILLDPSLNPSGYSVERVQTDPRAHLEVALQHALHTCTVLNQYCDSPVGVPDVWEVGMWVYNVYEAAAMGAHVTFPPGQLPSTEPFLCGQNKIAIFSVDIEHPLEHGYYKRCLDFWNAMERIALDLRFEGRPVRVLPWAQIGTDGPFTGGCNLRGSDFMVDMIEDQPYAIKLLEFLTRAAIIRRRALMSYWGDRIEPYNGLADDSCAMLSPGMYQEMVMPFHKMFFEHGDSRAPRSIHLCGNASHLFPVIRRQLSVRSFDTGFPIDHGALRQDLGTETEILGGPEVRLLLCGPPQSVYQRTTEILGSGVMDGGKFILREANNLPPHCPVDNLEAMYSACLDHGVYPLA